LGFLIRKGDFVVAVGRVEPGPWAAAEEVGLDACPGMMKSL